MKEDNYVLHWLKSIALNFSTKLLDWIKQHWFRNTWIIIFLHTTDTDIYYKLINNLLPGVTCTAQSDTWQIESRRSTVMGFSIFIVRDELLLKPTSAATIYTIRCVLVCVITCWPLNPMSEKSRFMLNF